MPRSKKSNHPWTKEALLKATQKLFMRDTTCLRFRKLDTLNLQATVGWSEDQTVIIVDKDQGIVISNIIHELLHVVLHNDLAFLTEPLREVVILGIEDFLWKYVCAEPRRLNWWRKAVKKKLNEPELFSK